MLNKTRAKQLLYGNELRSVAIITNGLVHSVPKRTVLKTLKRELTRLGANINLNSTEIRSIWARNILSYTKVLRKTFWSLKRVPLKKENYQEILAERQNIVYQEMKRTVLSGLQKRKNRLADHIEKREKRSNLKELLSEGVFYLCSSHIKPAKDHEDFEGKVYITEKWEKRVDDESIRAKIEAYIRNHDTKTVEWVTGAPIYMMFRPNCKHYFIEVSIEEVLGSSNKSLLKRYEMYMPEDLPMSYEYSQYKGYYERNKALSYLKQMCPSEELDKDIIKTRRLMKKWYDRAKETSKRNETK